MGPIQFKSVDEIKSLRVQADAVVEATRVRGSHDASAHIDSELYYFAEGQALRAAIETKMWLGKMLEGLGNPFPAELADKSNINASAANTLSSTPSPGSAVSTDLNTKA